MINTNLKKYFLLYFFMIVIGIFYSYKKVDVVQTFSTPTNKKIIYIDAGHGGFDPGVVVGDEYEKNYNLEIALRLQQYFEQSGAYVILSRAEDEATSNTKSGDMYVRKMLANENNADVLISIHQNSFQDSSVKGAQVFYYKNSEKSELLATNIQKEINEFAYTSNNKSAKSNDTYYLLEHTTIPAVIVECGFLTNKDDNYRLGTEEYQDKLAWSIYVGALKYFDEVEK